MGRIATLENIITKSKAIHGDKYEYVKLEKEKGSPIIVVCRCSEHGEFKLRAARHYTDGQGCPECSKLKTITSKDEFLHRAYAKHGNKYDYTAVKFTKLSDKVEIGCPIHGLFIQKANDHILYYGCPKCGVEKRIKSHTKDTEWFIDKAKLIHGDKYDYSKTKYTKASDKVTIICPEHGEFEQKAISHTAQKQGCPTCGGLHGKTTEKFIEDARLVHGDKYSYSNSEYIGALNNIDIICHEHGSFSQIASNHLAGSGCPQCSVTGFDIKKSGILYYIEITNEDNKYYKIGITNLTVQQRFSAAERSKIKVISITEYAEGRDAYNEEQKLLKQYKEYKYVGPDILKSGNTEIFTCDILRGLNE